MLAAARVDGQSAVAFPPEQRQRIEKASTAATSLLTEWLGAPAAPITVGTEVRERWLLPVRDQSLEREVIAATARQYWTGSAATATFHDALIVYTGTRAIHHALEGSNFEVVRFFGGFVPWPLSSILLSPPVADPRPRIWQFPELPANHETARFVRGLQTIERHVGWPTMTQALAALRAGGQFDPAAFGATLSAIRGTSIDSLVWELFRTDATFDYAIQDVRSRQEGERFESAVSVMRRGSGAFAIGDAGDPEPAMPILVRFADGAELRDWFDGRPASLTLVYTADTPIVYAAIDPDLMLLLDVNRANNVSDSEPPRIQPLGVRLALHWMSWLQHTMLTYGAFV
jgi:hypothetical protein